MCVCGGGGGGVQGGQRNEILFIFLSPVVSSFLLMNS